MDRFFRAIARLLTAMTISFGVRPPVIAVLELLRRPSVRIVTISRRRSVEYAALFAVDEEFHRGDEDSAYESVTEQGSAESPPVAIHRPIRRTYTRVRTA